MSVLMEKMQELQRREKELAAEAGLGASAEGAEGIESETPEQRKARARQRLEERRAALRSKTVNDAKQTAKAAAPKEATHKPVPLAKMEEGDANASPKAPPTTKAEKKAGWLGGISGNAVSRDGLKILERLKGSEPIIGGVITLVLFVMFVTFALLGGKTTGEVAVEKELEAEVGELHNLDEAVKAVSTAQGKAEFQEAVAKVAEIMGTNPEDALREALEGTEAAPALLQSMGDTSWASAAGNPLSPTEGQANTAAWAMDAGAATEEPASTPDAYSFSAPAEVSTPVEVAPKVEAVNPSTAILQRELVIKTRSALPMKLQALFPQGTGLLVGAGHGNFVKGLLKDWKAKKIVVMDPFGPEEGTKFHGHSSGRQNSRYQKLRSALSKNKNTEVLRATAKGADGFVRRYFDFIYLDHSHDYEKVKADVEKIYSKLKRGGVMAGSDYLNAEEAHKKDRNVKWSENKVPCISLNSECKTFKGVRAAVEEWAHNKQLIVKSTSSDNFPTWFLVKP